LQNGDAAERKYAPAAFEAAGLAVAGLLRLLASEGFYLKEDLAPGLAIAEQAAVELPRCAVRDTSLAKDTVDSCDLHKQVTNRDNSCSCCRLTLQLLGAYLPGPLNVVKDVLLTKQDEPQVSRCQSASWSSNSSR
jgi:hypothetical protein